MAARTSRSSATQVSKLSAVALGAPSPSRSPVRTRESRPQADQGPGRPLRLRRPRHVGRGHARGPRCDRYRTALPDASSAGRRPSVGCRAVHPRSPWLLRDDRCGCDNEKERSGHGCPSGTAVSEAVEGIRQDPGEGVTRGDYRPAIPSRDDCLLTAQGFARSTVPAEFARLGGTSCQTSLDDHNLTSVDCCRGLRSGSSQ